MKAQLQDQCLFEAEPDLCEDEPMEVEHEALQEDFEELFMYQDFDLVGYVTDELVPQDAIDSFVKFSEGI